jgi:hypothetical protein
LSCLVFSRGRLRDRDRRRGSSTVCLLATLRTPLVTLSARASVVCRCYFFLRSSRVFGSRPACLCSRLVVPSPSVRAFVSVRRMPPRPGSFWCFRFLSFVLLDPRPLSLAHGSLFATLRPRLAVFVFRLVPSLLFRGLVACLHCSRPFTWICSRLVACLCSRFVACLCSRFVACLCSQLVACLCSRLVPVLSACALSAYAFVPGSVVMACFHSLVFGLDPVFVRSSGFGLARFNLFRFFGPLFVPRFGTFVPRFRPLCLALGLLCLASGLCAFLRLLFGSSSDFLRASSPSSACVLFWCPDFCLMPLVLLYGNVAPSSFSISIMFLFYFSTSLTLKILFGTYRA